jgi:hypothetical protein
VKTSSGFSLTIILVALVAVAGLLLGAYMKGRADGAEPWIEQTAALESQLHSLKAAGDDRAKRAEAVAAKASQEMKFLRQELENERANTEAALSRSWREHIDGLSRPADGSAEAALAACRANVTAAHHAIDQLIAAAVELHRVGTLNTEQLSRLQAWVTEASR